MADLKVPFSGSSLALAAVALLVGAGELSKRGYLNVDEEDEIEWEDEEELEPPGCSECGGEMQSLGTLGSKHWFRCRACGSEESA
jgi:tRNA(Ile2) C34 agmatinyltransferase TiaS